jgi:hypothetical protein
MNTSTLTLSKEITGWDKALYFMTYIVGKEYQHIWFSEDDVFFNNEDTIIDINDKYKGYDLLCNGSFQEENLNEWLWHKFTINFPPPYYCAMVCICRFTNEVLKGIKKYAEENNTLFFLEALYPCIAKKNNLNCFSRPVEFKNITWCGEFTDINSVNFYHPVKDLSKHLLYRKQLEIN